MSALTTLAFHYTRQRGIRTLLTSLAVVVGVALIYATNTVIPAMQQSLEQSALGEDGRTLVILQGFTSQAPPIDEAALRAVRELPGIESASLDTLGAGDEARPVLRVRLEPQPDLTTIDARLSSILTDYHLMGIGRLSNISLQNSVLQIAFSVFGALALAVGAMLIFISFQTLVIQRQRDLGTLRMIGAERGQITRLILFEGLIHGVIGSAAGIITGQVLAIALLAGLWAILYQQFEAPGRIPFNIPALLLAATVGIGMTLLASYLPARHAGRLSPLQAFRDETTERTRKLSRVRLLVGTGLALLAVVLVFSGSSQAALAFPLLLAGVFALVPYVLFRLNRLVAPCSRWLFPHTSELIQAGLLRQPWRTSATVNLIFIGLAVIMGIVTLLAPFSLSQAQMIRNRVPDSDIELSGDRLSPALIEQVSALPQVARVQETLRGTAGVDGVEVTVLAVDPLETVRVHSYQLFIRNADGVHTLNDAAEQTPHLQQLEEPRTAFVSPLIGQRLDLQTGDTISLQGKDGVVDYRVLGVSDEDWYMPPESQGVIVVSQANAERDFSIEGPFLAYVELHDEADSEAAIAGITTLLPADYVYNRSAERQRMLSDSQRGTSIFYVMAVIVVIPAVLGLLNSLILNVVERTREISLLRSIGMDRGQVRRMVVGEALLLTTLAGLLALGVGVVGGAGMLESIRTGTVTPGLTFSLPLAELGSVFLVGLATAAVISLVPAHKASGMNIVEHVQYE